MAFLAGFAPSLPDEPAGAAEPAPESDPDPAPEPPSALDPDPESELDDESEAPSLLPEAAGFGEEYRSLYQPPPLSWNDVCEIWRSSACAPQASHLRLGGSLMRCRYSNCFLHFLHTYS